MAAPFLSIKTILQEAELVSQDQFETWTQQWRTAVEGGSEDTMLEFFSREKGVTDEQFLKQLADALKWPFVDLQRPLHAHTEIVVAFWSLNCLVAWHNFLVLGSYDLEI